MLDEDLELSDDDLGLEGDLGLDEELEINEYENTETLSSELGEKTDPNIDVDFDITEENPEEIGFADVDDSVEEDDEDLEEDDDYELDEEDEVKTSFKDKLSGFFSKFKKNKDQDVEEETEDEDDDDYLDDEEDDDQENIEDQANLSFKERMDKTLQSAVNIPLLKNLLNKNKDSEKVSAVDTEGNELDELELDENEEAPQRKKFKLTPIQIILVLIVLIAFIIPSEDEPTEAVKTKAQPRKPIKKQIPKEVVEKPVVEEPVVEKPVVEEPVVETPVAEVPAIEEPAKEGPAVPEITEESPELEPPSLEVPEVTDSTDTDSNLEEKLKKVDENTKVSLDDIKSENVPEVEAEVTEIPKVEETVPEVPQSVENEADSDLSSINIDQGAEVNPSDENLEPMDTSSDEMGGNDSLDETVAQRPATPAKDEEIIPQKELQPDISTEITKKLLQDLEVRLKEEKIVQKTMSVIKPTSAPSYEMAGEGLTYNCRGKHWACIEKDEYKKCRENYSWNKNEGIPLECFPVAVLKTEYDCAIVQQEKIDSVSDTDFCEE